MVRAEVSGALRVLSISIEPALFDILFGTFRNPREFDGQVGFFDGSSSKIGAMLIGTEIA